MKKNNIELLNCVPFNFIIGRYNNDEKLSQEEFQANCACRFAKPNIIFSLTKLTIYGKVIKTIIFVWFIFYCHY